MISFFNKRLKGCLTFGLTLLLTLLSFASDAHSVVFAEYSLRAQNGDWVLNFNQKTSQLRDVIWELHPELKGANLNSQEFLSATSDYILSNLRLRSKQSDISFTPVSMHFGGLGFESTFAANGLTDDPEMLSIEALGFDEHEHSIVVFRIEDGADARLMYFNRDQSYAVYDFQNKTYESEYFEKSSAKFSSTYLLAVLPVAAFMIWGFKRLVLQPLM